jgi:hypothetical protein
MKTTSASTAGSRDTTPDDNNGIDPLLAVQLSDRPRYDAWPGEARLALAVVEDAILTVRVTTGVRTPRAHRLAADAWAWLASRDTRHPFAFENLCDYLGLNAAWLRSGLRLGGYGSDPMPPATRRDARSGRRTSPASALRARARP